MARIPERAAAADANLSGKEIYDLARLKKQRSVGGGGGGREGGRAGGEDECLLFHLRVFTTPEHSLSLG